MLADGKLTAMRVIAVIRNNAKHRRRTLISKNGS